MADSGTSLFVSTAEGNTSCTRGRHFSTSLSKLPFVNEKTKISAAKESQRVSLSYTPQISFLRGAFTFLTETQDFTGAAVLRVTYTVSSALLLYSQ